MRFVVKVDDKTCDGCELCVVVCPQDVLVMSQAAKRGGRRYAKSVADDKCVGCQRCEEICPLHAVDVVHEPEG